MAADCKSARASVHRFESCPFHHSLFFDFYQTDSKGDIAVTQQDAIEIVRKYLEAMLKHDVAIAEKFIHSDAKIVYPGGKVFNAVATLSESSSKKFKTLTKNYERFEGFEQDNHNVVYVLGTLDGTWPDDTPFAGIRFVDRYEITDGRISMQEVWSDSAEFRLAKLVA
jgi:hypothetical protein